jgi:nucleoside-diphosphate kinase
VVGLFADTVVPGLLVAPAACGLTAALARPSGETTTAPARMKPRDTSRAVAEAARKAAPSVGKLFLGSPARQTARPQPATHAAAPANTCLRKKPQLRKWQGAVVPERTLILVKPDAVRRNLIGDVISRIERKGLKLIAMDLRTIERVTAESHYAEHAEKPFFRDVVEFITSGPAVALVAEGERAIEAFRAVAGATDPVKASPGTIRGDYALEVGQNMVHGSDSPEAAEREIKIFFPELV